MNQNRFFCCALLCVLSSLGVRSFAAGTPGLVAPLVWKPTSNMIDYGVPTLNLVPFQNIKIAVLPFEDNRTEKSVFGENRESATPKTVVTNGKVAEFATNQFRELLKGQGFPIVDKPENANISLSGELLNFNVVETQTYKGLVRIKLTIRSAEKQLWCGVAQGAVSRFGRSFKLENYYETLSDSLVEAVARLIGDDLFVSVLAGKYMVVPVSQPSTSSPILGSTLPPSSPASTPEGK